MLLVVDGKPRGIRCDLTGKEFFSKFTYYSLEGKMSTVDTSKKITNRETHSSLDLDLCEEAYEGLYARVKANIAPKAKPGVVRCDLSGKEMAGQFKYWSTIIAQVLVDVDQQEPMVVNAGIFDLIISYDEVMELIKLRDTNRAKEYVAAKQDVPKKEVIKLGGDKTPKVKPSKPKPKPAVIEQEIELEPEEFKLKRKP